MKRNLRNVFFLSLLLSASLALAEVPTEISFEVIPNDTQVVGGGTDAIRLQGDVAVAGTLEATGEVAADSGFRFPDGTLQLTATPGGSGITANAGLYSNTIVAMTPPQAYTEICFKNGGVQSDIHTGGQSTVGGNCLPGDIGWIIERFERAGGVASWTSARVTCLADGMRLAEPFEWFFACDEADSLAIEDMTDNFEWASNAVSTVRNDNCSSSDSVDLGAAVMGQGSCTFTQLGLLARNDGVSTSHVFRCVR